MIYLTMKREKQIQTASSHQAMVLKLADLCSHADDLQSLMDEAVIVIAATFDVPYCEILELLSDGVSLSVRARTAKKEDAGVETDRDTQESGIKAIIHKNETPFGVLQIDSNRRRKFKEEETNLLQLCANILSETIKRRELEEALQMSEEKYTALFEESKDVLFFSTVDGELIEINPAGIQLFGAASKDEMIGMNMEQDLYIDSVEREKYHCILFENGYVKNFELAVKTKKGQILFVQETSTAVRDDNGNVIAYRGVMRDITNVKLLQQELQQARKLELVGKLTSGVANDFNHLLNTIAGFCGAMDLLLQPSDPARQYLQKIDETVQKGSLLTWKLLAFGKERS